jgi:hypothetical protein
MPPRASVVEKQPLPPDKPPTRVLTGKKRANAELHATQDASDDDMRVDTCTDVSDDSSDDDASPHANSPTAIARHTTNAHPTAPHNKKHPINAPTPDHLSNNDPQYTIQHTIGQKKRPATSTAHTITHIAVIIIYLFSH